MSQNGNAAPSLTGFPAMRIGAMLTLGFFGFMFICSIVFYKEKLLFSDCCNLLFLDIYSRAPTVVAFRYSTAIMQWLPLLGIRLHAPLWAVMILFSTSLSIFCGIIGSVIVFRYKEYRLALLMGFYFILFVSQSFYYFQNNEGIPLLLLAFAAFFSMAQKHRPLLSAITFILLFGIAISAHPLMIPVAVYLWFFFMADKATWPFSKVQTYLYTAVLLLLCAFKYYYGKNHGYDSGAIETVNTFQLKNIRALPSAPQFRYFLDGCVTNYWLLVLILIAGTAGMLRVHKYLLAAMTLFFCGAYFVLLCITYWDEHYLRFYLEMEYMPLSVICAAPFVYYVLPYVNSRIGIIAVVLIFVIRLAYIWEARLPFTTRLAFIEKMSAKAKEKNLTKLVITDLDANTMSVLRLSWGLPYESIMLSRLNGEVPQRTFIFATPDAVKSAPLNTDMLGSPSQSIHKGELNSDYFQIDTTMPYQAISLQKLME